LVESPYHHEFNKDKHGVTACVRENGYNADDFEQFTFFIDHQYKYSLYLDGLPSATILRATEGSTVFDYFTGIQVGQKHGDKYLLYNHLELTVETHTTLDGHERIVAFDVEPFSIAEDEDRLNFSKKFTAAPYTLEQDKKVTFTWSITTKKNDKLTWQSRMDHYKKTGNDDIHLMQLIISFAIVVGLGIIVALILKRSLNRDLNNIEMSNTRRK